MLTLPTKQIKPSQRCPKCGVVHKHWAELSNRYHICDACGFEIPRDKGSVMVMYNVVTLKQPGLGTSLVDCGCLSSTNLTGKRKHTGSMRQLGQMKRQKSGRKSDGDLETPSVTCGGVVHANQYSPLPTPHSPFPTPHSPLPTPHSPFPTPHSPLPTPRFNEPFPHHPRLNKTNKAVEGEREVYLVPEVNVADSHLSDSYLAEQSILGDQQRFRQLYHRYHQKVRSTLYQLCGPSNLDDLVQEVFLRAWKGLPQLRQTSHFSTWLYRICWNVACDRRREFAQERSFNTKLQSQNTNQIPAPDLMQLHYQDLVRRGLAQLTLEHRAVIVLHDLEEVPQKEVAEILGIPVGTVKSRLFHARAAIRQFLQKQGVQL